MPLFLRPQHGNALMTDFPNRIIHILRGCPNGLTSKDIAERLGTTRRNLSSASSAAAVQHRALSEHSQHRRGRARDRSED